MNNNNNNNYMSSASFTGEKDDLLLSTPRKRTRATPEQLSILEKTFNVNPSPNNRVREQLSRELGMSERSIQIWFQNRRAKVKNIAKKSSMLHDETLRMQYYASSAAAAACQAAAYHQQQQQQQQNGEVVDPNKEIDIGDPIKTNPDLYYYYYYYYFNQQQQLQQRQKHYHHPYYQQQQQQQSSSSSSSSMPPPPISLKSIPPPPPPPPTNDSSSSMSPTPNGHSLWSKKQVHQQRARAHTIGPYYPSMVHQHQHQQEKSRLFDRGNSVEISSSSNNYYNKPPPPPPFPIQQHQHQQHENNNNTNFTHMLNNNNMSSPTVEQQQQFNNLSLQDGHNNNQFLPPSFFEGQQQSQQQQHQLAWTDLPFYQDTTLMMTPTTPSTTNMFTSPTTTTPTSNILQAQPNYTNTQKISAEALQIGTWKRMGFEPNDLICEFDKEKNSFSWCIQDGLSKFKMEFNQSNIEKIQLSPLEGRAGWARLEIELNTLDISFYMEVTPNWVQCRDYTEDKQASNIKLHYLDGPALALKAELDLLRKENSFIDSIIVVK